jgi:hypothetical protein
VLAAVNRDQEKKDVLPVYAISTLGLEVLGLCQVAADQEYVEELGKFFKSLGLKVVLADCKPSMNGFQMINPIEI